MTLALTIDKLEEVDESLRSLYTEKDGKFILGVDGLDTIQAEASRNATLLKKANKEAELERHKRRAWESLGKTPEEITQMLEELSSLQDIKEKHEMTEAEKKGQWDQLKAQMNEKHAEQIKLKENLILAEQSKNNDLRKNIEQHLIELAATTAIAEHKGIPQLLLPVVKSHIKVSQEENGKFTTHVVDAKGEPRVNDKGEFLSISEFVGEMRNNEVYGRAFEGSGSSGGGSRPTGNNMLQHPNITKKTDFKNETERSAFVEKFGIDRYRALPER